MANPKVEGLTKKEKEAVGLLSIGTFLEYFDLMLYIHMAALFNELFFPQSDPLTKQIVTAGTFCATFIIRPIGGIVIGKLGDTIGRKSTIIITTFIMASCCFTIFILPTYAEIGITASVVMIICRMAQGFSSLGEVVGSELYLAEILKSPYRNIIGGFIGACTELGGLFALIIGLFAINIGLNWRYAFLAGTVIACIGIGARTRLRETPEFLDYKRRIKVKNNKIGVSNDATIKDEKVDKKVVFAYFLTELVYPAPMCIAYVYMNDLMINSLGYSIAEVITQNLKVALFSVVCSIITSCFAKKINPIKIGLVTTAIFALFLPGLPYLMHSASSGISLLFLQCAILILAIPSSGLFQSVVFKYFPVEKRFFCIATIFGIAGPLSRVIVTFGFIGLVYHFNNYALWILFFPAAMLYFLAFLFFRKLEIKSGNYHNYPYKDEDVEADIHPCNYELGEEYIPYQKECKCSKRLIGMLESINKTAKKEVNIRLVEKAIAFAKKWHDGQKRKTGEPYYTHPLAVAMMTAQYKFKTHMVVAAILHDVVEDSKCTVELISKEFTPRIAEIVELLTREYNGKKLSIAETIKRIFGAEDYEALLIKGLDRVHNLQTIHGMKSKKQKEIAEETIYEIANVAAYAVDDLNINDKRKLERKLYKLSNKALKKSQISMNK